MKIHCINTASGLVPIDDESYDEKRRLRIGETYECDVKTVRNYRFLKKAHALVNAAWVLLGERRQAAWRTKEGFRAYLTVTAGYYDVYFNPRICQFVETPKSWAFDRMEESEFSGLYERMKDVIWGILGNEITPEDFERTLSNF